MSIVDVPEDEIFPVEEFREFRIRLINGNCGDCGEMRRGSEDVIDFGEWIRKNMGN